MRDRFSAREVCRFTLILALVLSAPVNAGGDSTDRTAEIVDSHNETIRASGPVAVDPVTGTPPIVDEQAKLLPFEGMAGESFGRAVSISGDVVVIGSPGGSDNGDDSGSAYVFVRPGDGWSGTVSAVAKLLPLDGAAADRFGWSVSVSGDAVVIGAPGHNDGLGSGYVYIAPAGGWSGTLTESAKLAPSDGARLDGFGDSLSISGDVVAVGAPNDDDNGSSSGSAYVFIKPPGGWLGTLNEEAKLLPSDGAMSDSFGQSVSISGDTVVVGSELDDDDGLNSGSAYVFVEPDGGWAGTSTEAAKLLHSSGWQFNRFGFSVSVSGDTVVVGSIGSRDNGSDSGSVHVFVKPAAGWSGTLSETAKLLPSDGAPRDFFGFSVSVSEDRVVASAVLDDDNRVDSGSAYVFVEPDGGWFGVSNEEAKSLPSDSAAPSLFGFSASVSGRTLVVGALGDDDIDVGSAYVFVEKLLIDVDVQPMILSPINLSEIPVAILGSGALDVFEINATTLRLGPDEASTMHDLTFPHTSGEHLRDINLDGYLDLMVRFLAADTGLACDDERATLSGRLADGMPFEGSDFVHRPDCPRDLGVTGVYGSRQMRQLGVPDTLLPKNKKAGRLGKR